MENEKLPHDHGGRVSDALRAQLAKTDSFGMTADVFKLLSDPSRVRIFWLLCHCEQCVVNISCMTDMSSPAVSHHLNRLKTGGLIESRREGKEVYYKASPTEQARLAHLMIEKTMEIACPEETEEELESIPELPGLDSSLGGEEYSAEQIETVHRVHELLTENLDRRYTIEELSRRFLMNPSTLKEVFKAVYGRPLAAHIKEHRMERAAELLKSTDMSVAEISAAVGYENQSKFSAEFKKFTGLLPKEYRRRRS